MNCNKPDEVDEALIRLDEAFEERASGLAAKIRQRHADVDVAAELEHCRRLWRTERQTLETRMRLSLATAQGQQ